MTHLRWIVLSVTTLLAVALGVVPTAGQPDRGVPTCGGVPATIVGTPDDDRLRGSDGRDVIIALGGNDVVRALSVDDIACGGTGADQLFEDPDAADVQRRTVIIYGDAGADRLRLTFGEAYGGDGDDLIVAGAGTRQGLYGDDGDDRLFGGEGRDGPSGGDGDDRLFGGPGPDYLRGEQGADLLVGGPGSDSAEGGRDRPDICKAENEYQSCEQ